MRSESIDTVVVGGGQAGLAMSEHLSHQGVPHLVLERHRVAERWRSERWDSLVANGPAWHDRFPSKVFATLAPDEFAPKEAVAAYFEAFAQETNAPLRCGVEVTEVRENPTGSGFLVTTPTGRIEAANVVAATGPFQCPLIPAMISTAGPFEQIHSSAYRNPCRLPEGSVLVIGAGSSGAQIADELLRAGRRVYLCVGPHHRPPRRYRGHDYCWWLKVLGKWDVKTVDPATAHVTISVSGAYGGFTVDFRDFAARGMTLLGMAQDYTDGILHLAPDLARNIAQGDANYLSLLDEADAYALSHGLDLPEEPDARDMGPLPDCVLNPVRDLHLAGAGVTTIIWATGYTLDFSWLKVNAFDQQDRPRHHRGISPVPGIYFLGLPWLSCRGSSFIWGVWPDAQYLAEHIAGRR